MDRLWAPWRAQYVRDGAAADAVAETNGDGACFLCRYLHAPEGDDRANLVAWRRPHSVVVLNRFPYNNGHLLIAPRVHKAGLDELEGEDLCEPLETMRSCLAVLDHVLRPDGYNVGLNLGRAAGAGLPGHVHWHVVPRWDGDTNFMPVLARAKVIVEALDEFFERFTEALADRERRPTDPKSHSHSFGAPA
jgi:ATP adenylyltransferase